MRMLSALRGDVRFQWKYGIYFLYAVFTAIYVMIILAVGERARGAAAAVLIFTDPAAMGLFFMGAIVLMEKGQRVNCAIAASPVKYSEYAGAKVLSLAAVGLAVSLVLALAAGLPNLLLLTAGVLLCSALCSMCGLIAAMKAGSINQFLVFSVPFEMLICLPPALLLFGVWHPALLLHPGVAAVLLICGDTENPLLCVLCLLLWSAAAWAVCIKVTKSGFLEMGGAEI